MVIDDTRQVALALDLGAVEMLRSYLAPRWDEYGEWAPRLLTYWRDEIVQMHGPVISLGTPEVGFEPETDQILAAVTLTHESGRRTRFGLRWINGRVQGVEPNPSWRPAGREVSTKSAAAVPTGAQTLALWDLPLMKSAGEMQFEGDAAVWTDSNDTEIALTRMGDR